MNVLDGMVLASLSILWSFLASIGVSNCRKSSTFEKSTSASVSSLEMAFSPLIIDCS